MPSVLRAKCIIAGESTVGKTAVAQVFQGNLTNFPKNYLMTRGLDLSTKCVTLPETNDVVEFYLYDSSGKDVYIESLLKYWENPELLMLVFDVTNGPSLHQCEKWLKLVQSVAGNHSIPSVLLGNKMDQTELRVISNQVAQETAHKLGLQYFECSAREMTGIEEPFLFLANELQKMNLQKQIT